MVRTGSRNFSSEGSDRPALFNTAGLASVVLVGGVGWEVYRALTMEMGGHQFYPVGETIMVNSQEEVSKLRQDRFNEGVKDACITAAIWGTLSTVGLFGLRAIEQPVFRSNALASIGAPRLAYIASSMAMIGFALRGEQALTGSARKPVQIRSFTQQQKQRAE